MLSNPGLTTQNLSTVPIASRTGIPIASSYKCSHCLSYRYPYYLFIQAFPLPLTQVSSLPLHTGISITSHTGVPITSSYKYFYYFSYRCLHCLFIQAFPLPLTQVFLLLLTQVFSLPLAQ